MNDRLRHVLGVALYAVMLGASGVLAGLAVPGPAGEPKTSDLVETVRPYFDGTYHWPAPVATNGTGANVPFQLTPAEVPRAVQQLLPSGGAEPTLGITSSGALFVVTGETVQRSRDQGRTWETVYDFVSENYPATVDRFASADPMLWVDPDTNRVFVLHMTAIVWPVFSPYCNDLAFSDDEGQTWTTTVLRDTTCDTPILLDHPKVMTARYGPDTILQPNLPTPDGDYPNVVYICTNKFVSAWCAVSYDGGRTIHHTSTVRVPTVADALGATGFDPDGVGQGACAGISGHPAAYPDGTVAVALCGWYSNELQPVVALTQDNGLTWSVREYEGDVGQVEIDPDLTVTPDGTAYLFFRGQDNINQLLRSRDKFATWEGPFRVPPQDFTMTVFTAITSGDDGRLAMAYLGTRTNQSNPQTMALPPEQRPVPEPSTARPGTIWHLYVTTTQDAGAESPTFYTHQVTPVEDPVQVGCIWMRGGDGGPRDCRNLLDFIDLTRDADGRFFVAFTDGCAPRFGCTTDVDLTRFQSRDSQVSVAVQDAGLSLLASRGVLPTLGLEPPRPNPR